MISSPTSSKRKRRIIVYGSVARYGPQSVATASDLKHSNLAVSFAFQIKKFHRSKLWRNNISNILNERTKNKVATK